MRLRLIPLNGFAALLAMAICVFGKPDAPAQAATPPQNAAAPIELAFSFTAENAPRHLALTLRELAEPRWRQLVGRRLEATDTATGQCRAEFDDPRRRSASQRLFELARCLTLWLPSDQAPQEQLLETRFAGENAKDLPDVVVTANLGRRIVPVAALEPRLANDPAVRGARSLDQLPETVRQSLCDRRKTFQDNPHCLISVGPSPRGWAIVQSATTYRMVLRRPIPQDETPALIEAVRLALHRGDPHAPANALYVLYNQYRPAVPEDSPTSDPTSQSPRTTQQYWSEMGSRGLHENLPLAPDVPIMVVDEIDDRPTLANLAAQFAQCLASSSSQSVRPLAGLAHAESVASVLFPRLGELRAGPTPPDFDPAAVRGGLRRREDVFSAGAHWQALMDELAVGMDEPSILISAWSDDGLGGVLPFLRTEAAAYLNRQLATYKVIAVLSAGKAWNGSAPEPAPARDVNLVGSTCPVWPSCMGGMPSVATVAASEIGPEGPRLIDPGIYALGARSVMVSAIGRRVPVIHITDPTAQPPETGEERTCRPRALVADGSSYAAPAVALLISELIALRRQASSQEDPQVALRRVYATVDPLQPVAETRELVRYGHVNRERALLGADPTWTGSGREGYSVLYPVSRHDGQPRPVRAAVESYPLLDVDNNLDRTRADLQRIRFGQGRGWLTLRAVSGEKETIRLEAVLRISQDVGTRDCVRRRQADPGATCPDRPEPMFDVFYLREEPWQLEALTGRDRGQPLLASVREVAVKRSVRFGEVADRRQGRCRVDGQDGVDQPPRPACLYMVEPATGTGPAPRFLPIDLWAFEDIVFPPHHSSLHRFNGHEARRPERCFGLLASAWSEAVTRVGLPGEFQVLRGPLVEQLRRGCRVSP